jgi:quercetin dioxygenase-like cupin family protein
MSHPDPHGPLDRTPIRVGEVWENPITRERATIIELPNQNSERRAVAQLIARVGARVAGEHRHPGIVERFTVLDGELTVKQSGKTSILRQGETATIEPDTWHDWWNATNQDARVRVEVTPGDRFLHMIETFFGLARVGHTDASGMPHLLQMALCAREFSDVIVFRSPPLLVQRAFFGILAPIARWRGYRATYPQFSRTTQARADVSGAVAAATSHRLVATSGDTIHQRASG